MCKSAHEHGGPKRCSADARDQAQISLLRVEQLEARRCEIESALDAARTYKTETAFRTALNAKLRSLAQLSGVDQQDLARRFSLQLFVSRLFERDPSRWLVTGGTALQFRSPQEARPTADLDLALRDTTTDLERALGDATGRRAGEHGEFLVSMKPGLSTTTFKGKIIYQLAGARFSVAELDVVAGRVFPFAPDIVHPVTVVSIDDVRPSPPVHVYAVASHVADKVAAMYELHGAAGDVASTRPHDLADLAILARCCTADAQELRTALRAEEIRRGIQIPTRLHLPDERWQHTYQLHARASGLPASLHDVDSALDVVNRFVGAALSDRGISGTWDPGLGRWA